MSDLVGDMQKRLINAETSGLKNAYGIVDVPGALELLRDARYLIQSLSLSEGSAQNRAAELEKEGGVAHSLQQISIALHDMLPFLAAIARKGGR
jgi:hypothetical protein